MGNSFECNKFLNFSFTDLKKDEKIMVNVELRDFQLQAFRNTTKNDEFGEGKFQILNFLFNNVRPRTLKSRVIRNHLSHFTSPVFPWPNVVPFGLNEVREDT